MADDPNIIRFQPPAAGADPGADGDLAEYARVLWRYRLPVAGAVFGTMVATALVNFCWLTPTFRATATIMPATRGGGPSLPASLMQAFGNAGVLAPLKGNEAVDRFVSVLQSRTVAEWVLAETDLASALDPQGTTTGPTADLRPAVRRLREEILDVDTTARGTIEVSAEWGDPERAAVIANAAVAGLERFIRERDLSLAARHRAFVEARRDATRKELAVAEETLSAFSKKHGLISVPEQTRALFTSIGKMHGEIAVEEARLDVLREYRGEQDPDVKRQDMLVQALKNRLVELEHGPRKALDGVMVQANGLIPLYQLPETGLDYSRLLRDVTVLNEVFTLLSGEVERAKIEERREEVAVQKLDAAQAPDRKARPRRLQNTVLAGVVAAFLSVLGAFAADALSRLRAGGGPGPAASGPTPTA